MNSRTTSKALLALLLSASVGACGGGSAADTNGSAADTDAPGSVAQQNGADDDSPDPSAAAAPQAPPAENAGTDLSSPVAPTPASPGADAPAEAPPAEAPATPPAPPAATDLDEDGVRMLLPSATGTRFRLGTNDPNNTAGFLIENNVAASEQKLGSLRYWNTKAFGLDYTAGGSGKTTRLHIIGGEQKYTWRTQSGFLSSPSDLRNQEYTAYVRVHDIFDAEKATVTLKIRGGKHIAGEGDLASCTMMTLGPNGKTMFGKELTHPSYDYVTLTPHFGASLQDNQWIGMKLVSYAMPSDPTKVVNQLYLDTNPFDADGKPVNGWKLFSEYIDTEGKSTGRYSKLANWGGEQTTLRTDGVSAVDFALVSAREVTPPN